MGNGVGRTLCRPSTWVTASWPLLCTFTDFTAAPTPRDRGGAREGVFGLRHCRRDTVGFPRAHWLARRAPPKVRQPPVKRERACCAGKVDHPDLVLHSSIITNNDARRRRTRGSGRRLAPLPAGGCGQDGHRTQPPRGRAALQLPNTRGLRPGECLSNDL